MLALEIGSKFFASMSSLPVAMPSKSFAHDVPRADTDELALAVDIFFAGTSSMRAHHHRR